MNKNYSVAGMVFNQGYAGDKEHSLEAIAEVHTTTFAIFLWKALS